MPVCKNCKTRLTKFDKEICPVCGTVHPFDPDDTQTIDITQPLASLNVKDEYQPKSRLVAGLLCLFLGCFAIQEFYLKRIKVAVIMLIINIVVIVGLGLLFYFLVLNKAIIGLFIGLFIVYGIYMVGSLYYFLVPDIKDGQDEFIK